MTLYEELKARGLIAQVTDEDLISDLINNGKATFYIGFDPTGGQPPCRTFHGPLSDETSADGRQQADRPDRWRNAVWSEIRPEE